MFGKAVPSLQKSTSKNQQSLIHSLFTRSGPLQRATTKPALPAPTNHFRDVTKMVRDLRIADTGEAAPQVAGSVVGGRWSESPPQRGKIPQPRASPWVPEPKMIPRLLRASPPDLQTERVSRGGDRSAWGNLLCEEFTLPVRKFHRDAIDRHDVTFVGYKHIRGPHVEDGKVVPEERIGVLIADPVPASKVTSCSTPPCASGIRSRKRKPSLSAAFAMP